MSQRKQRVEQRIKEEVSMILQTKIKDPRVEFVTITRVELKDDLRFARILYSVLGNDAKKKEASEGLSSALKYVRKLLGDSLELRNTPDFVFKLDTSGEYDIHISQVFEEIEEERKEREARQERQGQSDDSETDT
ncbi:MAG: 30S ribosome-binding factor RbfA [Candidatus Omnitrophica bacterium]|nr:30S ribosome-binding factor RbfA [Candidatus Omnitrophota bacterium]